MAGVGRNHWLAALLIAVLVVGAVLLPSAMWACALAALLALAGVVLFRGNRWRTAALLVAALALSLAMLDAFAGLLSPTAMDHGLVKTTVPRWWPPPDPDPGLSPQAQQRGHQHRDLRAGDRLSPDLSLRCRRRARDAAAPAGADTYLFLGDSFIFGQGLPDDETLAAQFAKANDVKVRAVNLGVPGNALNHLVRAFEAGLLDRYATQPVKAVVTWIIPAQLARVTGDGSWLGSSPRYVLENGELRHTGSFNEYRLLNPIAGAKYLLGEQFAFIDAIGMKQRQDEQVELFVAMMATPAAVRAREVRCAVDRRSIPGPTRSSRAGHGTSEFAQPCWSTSWRACASSASRWSSVNDVTGTYPIASRLLIPHDGHPTAFTNELIAAELKRRLLPQ